MLTLVSFNINGLRARLHQLQALCEYLQPDIIGLQESKVADESFPTAAITSFGYLAHPYGQKAHYGVALLSKTAPLSIQKGLPTDSLDAQRRLIIGRFLLDDGTPLHIINGYFPQGESRQHPTKFINKQQFYADLITYLDTHHTPNDALIVMGDMNVAPEDKDVGIGADNARRWIQSGKCGFLPEERAWLRALLAWGLYDSWRVFNPDITNEFTWFDYRSRGFERTPRRGLRVDLILVTARVRDRLNAVGIDTITRSLPRPSDHCPVWISII
ncbi:exodeoxyribonuclease III [Thiospirillum jenense]|uniref:Exodeoxyribonuclease III n=1 Tax=Thiospirillum jenense TaxID=1653858 RepID=A0A839HJ95_9GAMM|nr:exodeoxyribonuclease III [Thiospirillum jenense]MBB1126699.1 exodeoxyribonuclease III [Thiospirillum jenense]